MGGGRNGPYAELNSAAVRGAVEHTDRGLGCFVLCEIAILEEAGRLARAFARANVPGSYFMFAGDGPLRATLEKRAEDIGIAERVRVLGFVNRTGFPDIYVASGPVGTPFGVEPWVSS